MSNRALWPARYYSYSRKQRGTFSRGARQRRSAATGLINMPGASPMNRGAGFIPQDRPLVPEAWSRPPYTPSSAPCGLKSALRARVHDTRCASNVEVDALHEPEGRASSPLRADGCNDGPLPHTGRRARSDAPYLGQPVHGAMRVRFWRSKLPRRPTLLLLERGEG